MVKKKAKQHLRCKVISSHEKKSQELRDILSRGVPRRVLEIIASGKASDDEWLLQQVREAKSVRPDVLFAQGKGDEWIERMIEMFAVLSFVPGGSTVALGVKWFGLDFDAEKISGRTLHRREMHSNVVYLQEDPTHYPADTYFAKLNEIAQKTFHQQQTCAFLRHSHPLEIRHLPTDLPYPVPDDIEYALVLNPPSEEHIQEHIRPLARDGRMLVLMISDTPNGEPIHACVYLNEKQAMKILNHNSL